MGIIGLIIGMLSIIMCFFFPIVAIVLSVITLILGIVEIVRRKKNKNQLGLAICVIIIAIIAIPFSIVNTLPLTDLINNELIGKWYDSTNKIGLIINKDGTMELFTDDRTTLYIKGNYTLSKDEETIEYREYIFTVSTTDRVLLNEKNNELYTTQFSMVTDGKNMVMMNVITYSMYYFTKVS